MKREDFLAMVRQRDLEAISLLDKKGADYATEQDFISNFKTVSKCCRALGLDLSPSDSIIVLLLVKLQRLTNLRGLDPKNESVIDTLKDMRNYINLYEACLQEEVEVDCENSN